MAKKAGWIRFIEDPSEAGGGKLTPQRRKEMGSIGYQFKSKGHPKKTWFWRYRGLGWNWKKK
jgi:hypothetical protein